MKKIICIIMAAMMLMSVSSCSALFPVDSANTRGQITNLTVHYHQGIVREYPVNSGMSELEAEFLAPAGERIVGLFDENGIQYADYDCKVTINRDTPEVLYARYEKVDISYLKNDPPMALDEDPKKISYYTAKTFTWQFDADEYPEDEAMISACQCNPYADLKITVSFLGKGNTTHSNQFNSTLKLKDDVIGSFSVANLGSEYILYTYSGTVKAKQLMNSNYEFKVYCGAKYGYEEYTIKNVKVDFEFDFE